MKDPTPLPRRIFLSHRGVDKMLVRDYKQTLELLGLEPWLDDDDLHAGSELERGIQSGMKASCAAVFFITPAFVDEKFLRAEVNYAIGEKRQRGEAFSLITLVLKDQDGNSGRVPELLEPYVWKHPMSDLQGLREIVRALPEHLGDIGPRAKTSMLPDLRVFVKEAHIASAGEPTLDVVSVTIENHDATPVFLSGGASADRRDEPTFVWFRLDALGQHQYPSKLEPGAALNVMLAEDGVATYASRIRTFFFSDQIGRRYHSDEEETGKVLAAVAARHGAG